MLETLKKYNKLPKELRVKLSLPRVLDVVGKLEASFGCDFSDAIMRVMIKEIDVADLEDHFVYFCKLERGKAEELVFKLKKEVFCEVADYLELDDVVCAVSKRDQKKKSSGDGAIEKQVDDVVREAGLSFTSSILNERFRKIIKTNLVGVRDCLEVKQALIKPIERGGLGLLENSIEGVIKRLKCEVKIKEVEALKGKEVGRMVEARKNEVKRDVEYDFTKIGQNVTAAPAKGKEQSSLPKGFKDMIGGGKKEVAVGVKKEESDSDGIWEMKASGGLDGAVRAKKKVGVFQSLLDILPGSKAGKATIGSGVSSQGAALHSMPKVGKTNMSLEDGRVKMEDIKYVARTMSPVDELVHLNILNFRRLHTDPQKAIIKIMEKLDLLGQQGYLKKQQGARAWKVSPVNKMYIRIGDLSIANQQDVNMVIDDLKSKNGDYLTKEEFDAIGELNSQIKYL